MIVPASVPQSEQLEKQKGKRGKKNPHGNTDILSQEQSQTRKKRRKHEAPSQVCHKIQCETQRNADLLRREGIVPNTLFFPSLSHEIKRDDQLRAVLGLGLEELKTVNTRGKKMAWARFATESDCLDTILRLRLAHSSVKVSLHRPKQTDNPDRRGLASKNVQVFQKRVEEVQRNGGLGNTLMFRNLPVEVECDELKTILNRAMDEFDSATQCPPLRIRSAISKNGGGRNFWVVYPSVIASQRTFAAIHLTMASFRCGRTLKIHAFVHDDSTDADEKRRRERALALGAGTSGVASTRATKALEISNIDILEDLLRRSQTELLFMSPNKLREKR